MSDHSPHCNDLERLASIEGLGPLPEARKPDENGAGWFTAGQMLAYGAQERAAERERLRANEDQLVRIAQCVGRDASGAPEHDRTVAGAAIDEIKRLRADLRVMEDFADLWHFVSDEAPLEFEKIVAEFSPSRWLGEAAKLRTAKRWD